MSTPNPVYGEDRRGRVAQRSSKDEIGTLTVKTDEERLQI